MDGIIEPGQADGELDEREEAMPKSQKKLTGHKRLKSCYT
jgi:hypothetical protein